MDLFPPPPPPPTTPVPPQANTKPARFRGPIGLLGPIGANKESTLGPIGKWWEYELIKRFLNAFVFDVVFEFLWICSLGLQALGGIPFLESSSFTWNAFKIISGDLWPPRYDDICKTRWVITMDAKSVENYIELCSQVTKEWTLVNVMRIWW